jgi:hypothetical protein
MRSSVEKQCVAYGEPLPVGSHVGRKICVEVCEAAASACVLPLRRAGWAL